MAFRNKILFRLAPIIGLFCICLAMFPMTSCRPKSPSQPAISISINYSNGLADVKLLAQHKTLQETLNHIQPHIDKPMKLSTGRNADERIPEVKVEVKGATPLEIIKALATQYSMTVESTTDAYIIKPAN